MIENKDIGAVLRKADGADLSGTELKMLLRILLTTNNFGYSAETNYSLQEHFKWSERTVTEAVSGLKKKNIIRVVLNKHKNRRQIYICGLVPFGSEYEEPKFEEMSPEQQKFKKAFPNRIVDCEVPENVDMDALIEQIKKIDWINQAKNMTLKSFVYKYYNKIMNGEWTNSQVIQMKPKANFTQREYTKEEMNSLFQSVDEIEF